MQRTVIWGIDPGSNRFALAIREPKTPGTTLRSWDLDPRATWQEKLWLYWRQLEYFVPIWVKNHGWPALVAIERPAGARAPNAKLLQTYGLIQACVHGELAKLGGSCAWLEVGASEWKLAELGSGKADADAYCKALRDREIRFENADEAAAYWIAEYAARRAT